MHLDEAEALLGEHLLHGARQLLDVKRRPARHINRARGLHQVRQVERWIVGAVRIGRGDDRAGRGRRRLAAGHGVDQVVDADDLHIHVAAGGMDQVVAADGEQVAVARIHHHVELGIGQLQSGGERNGAAVRGVERIQVHVAGDAAGAADAATRWPRSSDRLGLGQRAGKSS